MEKKINGKGVEKEEKEYEKMEGKVEENRVEEGVDIEMKT